MRTLEAIRTEIKYMRHFLETIEYRLRLYEETEGKIFIRPEEFDKIPDDE